MDYGEVNNPAYSESQPENKRSFGVWILVGVVVVIIAIIAYFFIFNFSSRSLSETQLIEGASVDVEANNSVQFKFGEEDHNIRVNFFDNDSAEIVISSAPIRLTLKVNETEEADIDGDGINDIKLRFEGVRNGKAIISVKRTGKGICAENWNCSNWGGCSNEKQARSCNDLNNCGTVFDKPSMERKCTLLENGTNVINKTIENTNFTDNVNETANNTNAFNQTNNTENNETQDNLDFSCSEGYSLCNLSDVCLKDNGRLSGTHYTSGIAGDPTFCCEGNCLIGNKVNQTDTSILESSAKLVWESFKEQNSSEFYSLSSSGLQEGCDNSGEVLCNTTFYSTKSLVIFSRGEGLFEEPNYFVKTKFVSDSDAVVLVYAPVNTSWPVEMQLKKEGSTWKNYYILLS